MRDIQEIRSAVRSALWSRISLVRSIWRAVELGLVLGGSSLAVFVGFLSDYPEEPLTTSDYLGMVGVGLAAIGSIAVWRAKDPVEGLAEAQEALDQLGDSQLRFSEMSGYTDTLEGGLTRISSLYVAFSSARSVLETAAASGLEDEITLIEHCLRMMKSDLRIATGLEMTDEWTIGVYVREVDPSDGGIYLRLVAQDRSTDCDISRARRWPQGVGVGGIALAKDLEVVAPDIQAYDARGLFMLHGDVVRAMAEAG